MVNSDHGGMDDGTDDTYIGKEGFRHCDAPRSAAQPEGFPFSPHPEICQAILAVRASGQRVGLRTVSAWLQAQGQLDAVGGTLYLAEVMLTGRN